MQHNDDDGQIRRRHRLQWVLRIAVLLIWPFVSGCDQQGERAIQASERFSVLMKQADWAGVGGMLHPVALAQVREIADVIQDAHPFRQDDFSRAIFGVPPDLLKAIPDQDLLLILLRRLAERRPDLVPALSAAQVTTLGQVRDGDTIHVVARVDSEVNGEKRSTVGMTSLREHEGEWKVLLSDDVADAIRNFRATIAE